MGLSRAESSHAVQSVDEVLDQATARSRRGLLVLAAPRQLLASRRGWRARVGSFTSSTDTKRDSSPLSNRDAAGPRAGDRSSPPCARNPTARTAGQPDGITAVSLTGPTGRELVRQAAGRDSTAVRRRPLPVRPIEEQPLVPPTADRAAIADAIAICAARLGRTCAFAALFARSITVRVRYVDNRSDSRTLESARAVGTDRGAPDICGRDSRTDRSAGPSRSRRGLSCSGLLDGAGAPALFPLSR